MLRLYVDGLLVNLGTFQINTTNSQSENKEVELENPFFAANDALDKGFTFNEVVSEFKKLPIDDFIEDAGNVVTGVGVVGNVYNAGNSFAKGNNSDGTYYGLVAASFVAVAIICPEGLLFWGIEVMVADAIRKY